MGVFSGYLISVSPTTIKYGRPIDLVIKWTVSTSSAWEVINGWAAKLEISLDGLEGEQIESNIFGYSTKVFNKMVNVGPDVMPSYNLSGYIIIKCYKGWPSTYYEVVYYEPITIVVEGVPDDNGLPDDEGEFPIVPIALAAGCLLVVTAAVTKKRK